MSPDRSTERAIDWGLPIMHGLIADDDEYFRMALAAILRDRLGFRTVIETGSFDEAMERLEHSGQISLAVFDLSMPGLDSPAALRTIRQLFTVDKLAVVSATRDREEILQSLTAGAHGFVSKRQGINELQEALKDILEGKVYVSPLLADLSPGMHEDPADHAPLAPGPETPRLSARQRDVLQLLVAGKSNKEIARSLNLGPGTVKVHLAAVYRNLGVSNRAAAAVAGVELLRRLV